MKDAKGKRDARRNNNGKQRVEGVWGLKYGWKGRRTPSRTFLRASIKPRRHLRSWWPLPDSAPLRHANGWGRETGEARGNPWGGTFIIPPLAWAGPNGRANKREPAGKRCNHPAVGERHPLCCMLVSSESTASNATSIKPTTSFHLYAPKTSTWLLRNSQLRITWCGNWTELRTDVVRKLFCCEKPSLLYYSYFSRSSESTAKKRLSEVRQLYGFSSLMQIIHRTSNDQDRSGVLNMAFDCDGTMWWLIFSLFLK